MYLSQEKCMIALARQASRQAVPRMARGPVCKAVVDAKMHLWEEISHDKVFLTKN